MEGDAVLEIVLFDRGGHVVVEGGADDAGGDAVDADVVVGQFVRQATGEVGECALDGLVGEVGADGALPADEEIRTIDPLRRCFMEGTTARQRWKTAWTWTSNAAYQLSGETSSRPPVTSPPAE